MHHRTDILFLLRHNTCYSFQTLHRRSAGLFNSVSFITDALKKHGVKVHIEEVIDSNCIDKWLTLYKPKIFVAEAIWVPPYKFAELRKLHPKVKMYCRLHSMMPFLSLEGIALEWIKAYAKLGVDIMANSPESYNALRCILNKREVGYFPNMYTPRPIPRFTNCTNRNHKDGRLHIIIGGAVRPFKNHLTQALAAIQFAKEKGKRLSLHINATRLETNGEPVLKNLRALFENEPNATLVEFPWLEHHDFLAYLKNMDMGLQVSLTETFSIVSADYCTAGIPMVVSKEISWANRWSKAADNDVNDIVEKMHTAWNWRCLLKLNKWLLKQNSSRAEHIWLKFVKRA